MKGRSLRVLVVTTDEPLAIQMVTCLSRCGYRLTAKRVCTPEVIEAAAYREWDVILCDSDLGKMSAAATFELLREAGCEAPFILVAGSVTASTVERAMVHGVDGHVSSDRLDMLPEVIASVLES